MTGEIDIPLLRKLESAATPAPWDLLEEDSFDGMSFIPIVAGEMGTASFGNIAECSGSGDEGGVTKQDQLNAEFIFKFRNAAPALLAKWEECDDLRATFDLRWKADMRAIERWRAAGEGRELTMPDHADLCVWLLSRLAAADAVVSAARAFIDVHLNDDGDPRDPLRIAIRRYDAEGKSE